MNLEELVYTLSKYWITLPESRNPNDLVDYYVVLAYMQHSKNLESELLYAELSNLPDATRDVLMQEVSNCLKQFKKFLDEM